MVLETVSTYETEKPTEISDGQAMSRLALM